MLWTLKDVKFLAQAQRALGLDKKSVDKQKQQKQQQPVAGVAPAKPGGVKPGQPGRKHREALGLEGTANSLRGNASCARVRTT